MSPMGIFKCRWCSKRMKLGAEVCHHCGREQHPASEAAGDPAADAVREVAARLKQAGMTDKGTRLRATVQAMELVHAGERVEDAVAAVLPPERAESR